MTQSSTHRRLVNGACDSCETSEVAVMREHPVWTDGCIGYIDAVVFGRTITVAIEAERTNRRIENDIAKAAALPADYLLIVVPNPKVKRLVVRRLGQLACRNRVPTYVGCLPEVVKQLRLIFPTNPRPSRDLCIIFPCNCRGGGKGQKSRSEGGVKGKVGWREK